MLRSIPRQVLLAVRRSLRRLLGGRPVVDPRGRLPIIIFQPGKVGSSSVHASLLQKYEELGLRVPIHHAHVLQNIDDRVQYVTKHRQAPAATLRKLEESRRLRDRIASDPARSWNVINLVREPVAMKVSALFQVLHEYLPDWETRWKDGTLSMEELDDFLFHRQELGTSDLAGWYDVQVKSLWGIDVFAELFPCEKGYHIYRRGNINLLIVRLEDLNRVAGAAFEDFLGLPRVSIVNANVGQDKPYAALYAQYKKRPLPAEFVDAVYAGRLARHFYAADEIERFRKAWLKQ